MLVFYIAVQCRSLDNGYAQVSTTRSSGKKYVIEETILHNLLKSNSCRESFDKFTKILLKNCTISTKNFPPPPPPSPTILTEMSVGHDFGHVPDS